jgi:hypothetical protein
MVTAPTSASQLPSTVGRIRKHRASVLSSSAWIRITTPAGRKVTNLCCLNFFTKVSAMYKLSTLKTDADDYVDSLPSPHNEISTRTVMTIVLGLMLLTSLVVRLP